VGAGLCEVMREPKGVLVPLAKSLPVSSFGSSSFSAKRTISPGASNTTPGLVERTPASDWIVSTSAANPPGVARGPIGLVGDVGDDDGKRKDPGGNLDEEEDPCGSGVGLVTEDFGVPIGVGLVGAAGRGFAGTVGLYPDPEPALTGPPAPTEAKTRPRSREGRTGRCSLD
jgi:hypothetical protein